MHDPLVGHGPTPVGGCFLQRRGHLMKKFEKWSPLGHGELWIVWLHFELFLHKNYLYYAIDYIRIVVLLNFDWWKILYDNDSVWLEGK